MNNLTSNWRVKNNKKSFDSKLSIFDKFNKSDNKQNPFKKNNKSFSRFKDTENIFNKKNKKRIKDVKHKKEIKSFNKKIIIHKKEKLKCDKLQI